MFSCELSEISKNTFFTEHLREPASGSSLSLLRTYVSLLFSFRMLDFKGIQGWDYTRTFFHEHEQTVIRSGFIEKLKIKWNETKNVEMK